MDDDPDLSEPSVTARERALQEKIIRLEKRLEGYQTQIDIIDSQRQQLEERAIKMESTLAKAKNRLLEARKELMDKEIAAKDLTEKLNSMTKQAEEYKNLFIAERNKNRYSIETLEALLCTVEAEIAPRKEFQGFLNEIRTEVKEGFYAQLKVVFDKLTEAESRFHRSPQQINQCKTIPTTSCSATQFGICVKEELSTAASSSPTQYGLFDTATTTIATSNSQIPFEKIGTAAITSATGNSPTQNGLVSTGAITTATSNSPTQYGMSDTGAITKATTSWPTRYGMIGTAATTRTTSSSSTQHRPFGTTETTTVTSSSPPQYEMIGRAVTTTFSAMPPLQSSQTQVPFKHCQKMTTKDNLREQETTANSTSKKSSDQMAKFAPLTNSWTCPVCLISNKARTTVCVACGPAKLSDGTKTALAVPKAGFHLPNGTTTSCALNTVSGTLRGNTSSGSPLTFGKSDTRSVKSSPFKFEMSDTRPVNSSQFKFGISDTGPVSSSQFKFGISDTGPVNSSQFKFGISDTGPVNSSQFKFGISDTGPVSSSQFKFGIGGSGPKNTSPFSFGRSNSGSVKSSLFTFATSDTGPKKSSTFTSVKSDAGTVNSSPFTSEKSIARTINTSSFRCVVPPLAPDHTSTTGKATVTASQVVGGSTQFNFGSSSLTGSSPLSVSMPQKVVSENTNSVVEKSVIGGSTPEQGGASLSFGSFNTGTSSSFDLDIAPHSTFRAQPDPLVPDEFGDVNEVKPNVSQEAKVILDQSQPSFSFGTFTDRNDVPEEKMFWKQPTGTFPFGQLDAYAPMSGATTWTAGVNPWHQATQHSSESKTSQIQSALQTSGMFSQPLALSDFSRRELLRRLAAASSSPMPPIQSSQTQPPFSPRQGKPLTSPLKPVRVHSTLGENAGPSNLPSHLTGRHFLPPKSALKAIKKQEEDCLIVYEVRASMANREKASRLFLPVNFFNYGKQEVCPGCLGCRRVPKESTTLSKKEDEQSTVVSPSRENIRKPEKSASRNASHVFGEPSIAGQLTFSTVKPKESGAFSLTQNRDGAKPFQGAGTQLFAEISEDVEGQDEDKIHFEPVIPLPDEIEVVTGEEGLEVLFSERAKLYRFDADSGQWKERGVGDVKLLRHPKSGQGRVLMRREQIKKLCANHNINSGMELKPNVGSDRSWVWYTPADYAEGEARPEKLAIKLKSAEIAGKFRNVFEDLKETFSAGMLAEVEQSDDQQGAGCALYKQFSSTFAASSDAWTCEMCYVENSAKDSKCIACNSAKPRSLEPLSKTEEEEDAKVTLTGTNTSVFESVERNTYQDFNKDSNSAGSIFQSPGLKGLASSQPFTIGRVESSEDKLDDEIYLSPSKTSSQSKQGLTPQTPSTSLSQGNVVSSLSFGTNTPAKFTFSLQVSPESPSRKPKSPLSPASPMSSESPGQTEDDGPHFEPVIPLPEKVECRTGEEGHEVMFCERCKLFRYDSDGSQWKERGVGDIKILLNPNSGRYRVLMRREHVFRLCANHIISVDMELKPFPNSDRAWLWTTLADFSDEVTAAETVGAKFKTSQVAAEFKDTFDKALHSLKSEGKNIALPRKPDVNETGQENGKKQENDILLVFERRVTEDQKERAKRLELPSNFYGFEDSLSGTDSKESGPVASEQSKPTADVSEELSTASKLTFLFGFPSGASLSFQSVAASSLGSSPFGQKSQQESPGFIGAGSQLFATQNTEDDAGTAEVDHDGPHFEPIIPLPDKIDVKTGEDEEVMFSHRAKLYRHVADDKQWKERGVGDIKLLRNRQSGKMRVLMRRDQVLKICANHQITIDMQLQPISGSDRSWVWSTLADFSEQECKAEQLAVRFKSEDIAKQFKEKFEECQDLLKNQTPVKTLEKEQVQEEVKDDLVTKFKAPEGSWECQICMVRNDSDTIECAACGGLKPEAEPRQDQQKDTKSFLLGSTAPSSGSVFSFGSASQCTSTGFSFGSAGTSQGDERFSTFGSFGETQNFKTGIPIRFGSFRQEHVREQQTEDNKEADSPTVKETARKEGQHKNYLQAQNVQDVEKFEECQELLKTHTQVKILQKEQAQEVKDGLVTKYKAAEGSWE